MEGLNMALVNRSNSYFPIIPSLFDNFFTRDLMDWNLTNFSSTNTTLPSVNVKENDDEFEIEVAAPGMKKDDFRINLNNGQLTISSEKKNEQENKSNGYSRKEFSYESFQRSFTLPENMVDSDKISAKYADGILYVNIPKKEEVKPKPVIEIRVA